MKKVPFCPFCGSTKLKVDGKAGGYTHDGGGRTGKPYTIGQKYVCSLRCNACHSRGPTASFFVPTDHVPTVSEIQTNAYKNWPDKFFVEQQ